MIKPYACMRCMAQSDDTICPVCGAPAEDAQRIRGALAPQTILNGKYLVGAALGGGGFGVLGLIVDGHVGFGVDAVGL